MHLESGTYIISSKFKGLHIGLHPREDRSLRPKLVITLPTDVQAPKWRVEKLPDGVYRLSTMGSYATDIEEKVFAVVLPEHTLTEWTIKPIEHYGPNVYTIQAPSRKGWVVPEEQPETQIIIRHLIIGPSEPPHYPSNQLFEFVRIDRD